MQRIVPGFLIAGFWLALLLFGSAALFWGVTVLICLKAADEYLRMADSRSHPLWERGFFGLTMILPVVLAQGMGRENLLAPAFFASFALLCGYILCCYHRLPDSYSLFSRHLFGIFYVGFLGAHLILLRNLPDGAHWLIVATAITACSDTGAYFSGKRFGQRPLCPNISPKKTVEGALGGFAAGILAALICTAIFLETSLVLIFFIATLLVAVGIAGDLTESIIKRGTGTKDSGRLLAGHGGILDRIDSLLLVAPVLYYLITFLQLS